MEGLAVARFDLMDFEWSLIEPVLPWKSRGVLRTDHWRVLNGIFLGAAFRRALGQSAGAKRPAHDLLQPLSAVEQSGHLGQDYGYH